jgi:hypothetical protein
VTPKTAPRSTTLPEPAGPQADVVQIALVLILLCFPVFDLFDVLLGPLPILPPRLALLVRLRVFHLAGARDVGILGFVVVRRESSGVLQVLLLIPLLIPGGSTRCLSSIGHGCCSWLSRAPR